MALTSGSGVLLNGVTSGVSISYSAALNPSVFTIELWVKARRTDHTQVLVDSHSGNTGYYIDIQNGNWIGFIGGGSSFQAVGNFSATTSETHLALVYDGTTAYLYVNGVLSGSAVCTVAPNTSADTLLGDFISIPNAMFGGCIWDVRLWSVARSRVQVQADMNSTLDGTEPGLVGWWPMSEGMGSVAHDFTSNGNHGTINGPVRWAQQRTHVRAPKLNWPASLHGTGSAYIWTPALLDCTKSYTKSIWVRFTGSMSPQVAQPYYNVISDLAGGHAMWITNQYGPLFMQSGHSISGVWQVAYDTTPIAFNEWTHFASVFDASASQMTLYRNGVAIRTSSVAPFPSTTTHIQVGSYSGSGGSNDQWVGDLSDAMVWQRALTPLEVVRTMMGSPPMDAMLVGYRLNEGSGLTVRDISWNKQDGTITGASWITNGTARSLASGNPGTITGGVTVGHAGPLAAGGGAYLFDGTSGYVQTPFIPSTFLDHAFSIEGWMYVTTSATYNPLFSVGAAMSTDQYVTVIDRNNNYFFDFWADSITAGAVPLDQWVHVVCVWAGPGSKTMSVYVNGTLLASGTSTGSAQVSNGHQTGGGCWIGAYYDGSIHGYFNGRLAEVAVYRAALSAARIQAHYNAASSSSANDYPSAVLADNPIGYWRLNEKSGTAAYDSAVAAPAR